MPAWCHPTTNKPCQQNMLGVWFKRVLYMVTYRYLIEAIAPRRVELCPRINH